MVFDPNIPQPNHFLADSQGQILSNFTVSNAVMDINHYPFNNATADKGKHKFMQMPEIPNATVLGLPSTSVNEGALYTKVGANPAETNLFFRAENSGGGGGFEYQITKAYSANTASFGQNSAYVNGAFNFIGGWTFLPGGLILQYGQTDAVSANPITCKFRFAFNTIFQPWFTLSRSSGSVNTSDAYITAGSIANDGFTVANPNGHTWIVRFYALGI